MPILLEWTNFYVILGSAAGALTGLQFVVMALIADMPVKADEIKAAAAFATPTIVHFVAVLLFSTSTAMPFHSLTAPAWLWAAGGVSGLIYSLFVTRRMIGQTAYQPVIEDWLFHAVLPIAGYLALAAAAVLLPAHTRPALFTTAAALLLLLTCSIHNAWDNVTYLVHLRRTRLDASEKQLPRKWCNSDDAKVQT